MGDKPYRQFHSIYTLYGMRLFWIAIHLYQLIIQNFDEDFWEMLVQSSWNVMAHDDAREGKWRGNWLMEWVAGILHTTSELGLSSTTTADAHTSAASSRLNWSPHRFKWTRPFRRKTKSDFCAGAITFQTQKRNSCNVLWMGRYIASLWPVYRTVSPRGFAFHWIVCGHVQAQK